MERKKIGQIKGRISRRRLVCNPTIQHVIINLYTKYDPSSLQGCGEIFDEKVLRNYGRTDGRTDRMTDRCRPVYPPLFQSGGINTSLLTCIQNMTTLPFTVSQKSLKKNFIIQSMERKKMGKIQGRIRGEGCFTIPQYNTSLSTCLPNITILACTVSQKSLTKNFIILKYGEKENWTNTGKHKQKNAGSQSHDTIHHYQTAYQI